MITSLTPEQEAKIQDYKQMSIKLNLDCSRFTQEDAETYAKKMGEFLERDFKKVIVCDGPVEGWKLTREHFYASEIAKKDLDKFTKKDKEKMAKFIKEKANFFIRPYFDGCWNVWYSIIKYYEEVLELDLPDYSIVEGSLKFGMIFPLNDTIIFSQKPLYIKISGENVHCDTGPAIEYADGFKMYYLNGVHIPKEYEWLVNTPVEELDCSEFPKIQNVEIRREFLRKVGAEQLIQNLGAETIDEDGDYSLVLLDLKGDTGKWPYLKMRNPSINCWHVEAVSKECKTVADAIAFRNGTKIAPEILT